MYKFDKDDAFRFAQEVGIKVHQKGDELIFRTCPYCRETSRNDKEKFAINLKNGQFNCFRASCGAKGNMITLSKEFGFSLGNEADEYNFHWKKFKKLPDRKPDPTEHAYEYMRSRGIPDHVTDHYRITTQKDKPNILVFPFYDEFGKLQFVKYRNTEFKKGDSGSKEWAQADCKPILFGVEQCDRNIKTLIITEGQIDSLSVAAAGIQNAVSVPTGAKGFTWVPHCWDWLTEFSEIIVFGDYEKGKITLLEDLANRFEGKIRHVRYEDYLDCKDANEILLKHGAEQIKKCIKNAQLMPSKNIRSMSEVEQVNTNEMENFNTGIKPLDTLLGGMYFGRLYLITGKAGLGKSTLASQLVLSGLNSDHNVFIYSGELSNGNVKEWINLQLAGREHINRIKKDNGFVTYSVDYNVQTKINVWYSDRLFIASDEHNFDDEEASVEKVMEEAIVRFGCRIVLIDNLMTALSDDATYDQLRQQSKFVKSMKRIATKHNVCVILVVHPRKGSGYEASNDDVSGSANIVNLADYLLRIFPEQELENGKVVDVKSNNRTLAITKNRVDGRLVEKGFPLYYEPASRRYSSMPEKFDFEYGWVTHEFEPVNDEEVPVDW